MKPNLIWIVAGAFGVSLIATDLMRRYALQKNLIDVPNSRSSHALPTPRGGGVAIVLAFFLALLEIDYVYQFDLKILAAMLAGGGAIALIGFLDDRRTLPAGLRFAVHFVAAVSVVLLLGGIPEAALVNWGLHGALIGMPIAVLTLMWVANLFNFMDGIDGIAGSEAVFILLSGAWLNWHQQGDPELTAATLCLGAASAGFLIWNWPPARIFLGDVGSGFLGFTIAVLGLVISQHTSVPVEAWAILGGVFVVDATVTLFKRVLRGDRWFEAHRMHAYQHLSRRWKSHRLVTFSMTLINVVWLLPWALIATRSPGQALWCLIAALGPLVVLAFVLGAGARDD
jgi:Fuc2NAc and GlcNAc transferase